MKALVTLSAATLLAAGTAVANPVPAEGVYIPGPANYGAQISLATEHVFMERERGILGLSGTDKVTVTMGDAPAYVSQQRGR